MTRTPLMPKSTAVWLIENTALSFDQIATFCGMHVLEVKGIADDDVAKGFKGVDPISSGQLTRQEIEKGEGEPLHVLQMATSRVDVPQLRKKKGPRYTPVSRRHDRPNAILWLVKSHPELKDAQIMRLVGTTKPTIDAIRTRGHWNSNNLIAQDPVTLGLCSQLDLDGEVQKAAKRAGKDDTDEIEDVAARAEGTLLPTEESLAPASADDLRNQADELDPDAVLARMMAGQATEPPPPEGAEQPSSE
jgi:uncharacterized protein